MRTFHLSLLCLIAFGVTLASLSLPVHPVTRSTVAPAIAQTIEDRKAIAERFSQQGKQQFQTGQFREALQSWEQALAIYREISDRKREGVALGNLGVAYNSLGQSLQAIEYLEQALAIAREIDDRQEEGRSLGNLGLAYLFLGHYSQAIGYFEHRLEIAREAADRQGESKALNNLGVAYDTLGQYQTAIDYLEQGLVIAKEIGDRQGESQLLGSLGNAYRNLGQYSKAIEYLEQDLVISREIGDRQGEGQSLGNLGIAYSLFGQYQRAIEYHEQALAILRETGDQQGEGAVLSNLGIAHDALNQYPQAIKYYEQRLSIARTIGDRQGEGAALSNLGVTFLRSSRLAEAEIALFDALAILQSLLDPQLNDANRISLFDTQSVTYSLLQQVLITQNNSEKTLKALEVSEQGRARSLVELLSSRLASSNPAISSTAPDLAEIRRIVQQQNMTLVQYSVIDSGVGDPALYIWVVKPTGDISFQAVDLSQLQQPLADLIGLSRTAIGARGRSDVGTVVRLTPEAQQKQDAEQRQALKQLYQLLIQPIKSDLPTTASERIVFIPQGDLFLVPFAALLDDNDSYLIEQHTLSTAPSIQVLDLAHQSAPPQLLSSLNPNQVLVVGNPTMPNVWDPNRLEPIQLPSLPGSEVEAEAIAQQFGTQPLLSDQASETTVTQRMQTARLIHLATHGLLDYGDPTETGILDAPGAIALAADGNHDGLLTARELYPMTLQAELVVLSACDTGRGRITGDGVVGLSRSLIQAGVPSLVVSLWKVPDESTAYLMQQFYQNLQNSPNKAHALRQAMLDTMQQYPQPLDWAAFTLIGAAD